MGTKFTVYDSGLNPMKSTTSLEASNLRQELAAICYVSSEKLSFIFLIMEYNINIYLGIVII